MGDTLRIKDFDDPNFDPFTSFDLSTGAEEIKNPYPRLAELQAQAIVHPAGIRETFGTPSDATMLDLPKYMVLGFDAVSQVFSDAATFSNKIYERNLGRAFGRSITVMDPPEHLMYRKIFQKAFTPNVIAKWGTEVVAPVVNRLLDPIVERGHADLIKEFTVEYPFRFIYGQLDLPEEDVDTFHRLGVGLMCITHDVAHGMEANEKLGVYLSRLIPERRANPGDDLISMLAHMEVDGVRLPDEILLGFLRQLLNAGGDTTFRSTSNTLVGLLTHPEQLAALQKDRSLMLQTIEEGLRWDMPSIAHTRTPVRDVVLGGVEIPAGACIDLVSGSANRDPSRFENPNEFSIYRKPSRVMTFGFGPHICIGQHLARLEMQVALNALLDRLPNLRADEDYPPPEIHGLIKRSPSSLHVKFG